MQWFLLKYFVLVHFHFVSEFLFCYKRILRYRHTTEIVFYAPHRLCFRKMLLPMLLGREQQQLSPPVASATAATLITLVGPTTAAAASLVVVVLLPVVAS